MRDYWLLLPKLIGRYLLLITANWLAFTLNHQIYDPSWLRGCSINMSNYSMTGPLSEVEIDKTKFLTCHTETCCSRIKNTAHPISSVLHTRYHLSNSDTTVFYVSTFWILLLKLPHIIQETRCLQSWFLVLMCFWYVTIWYSRIILIENCHSLLYLG
jgi:hypothetical protein